MEDNPHPKPCFCAKCAPAYNQTVLLCMAERLRLHGDNLQTLAERWDGFDRDALVRLSAALTDGSQVLLLVVARMRGMNGTTYAATPNDEIVPLEEDNGTPNHPATK